MRILLLFTLTIVLLAPGLAVDTIKPSEARARLAQDVRWLMALNESIVDDYFHSGDWDKAVAGLERMIELDPTQREPYLNAAWLLWSSGNKAEGIAYYDRLINALPNDGLSYYEVGYFYFIHEKNYEETARWLEKANARDLPQQHRHLYGHALEKLGRTADALAYWQSLIDRDPTDDVAKQRVAALTAAVTPQPEVAP